MIVHGFVFCDLCHVPMGKLWNQPAAAPDLLPAPNFRVCDDCHADSSCSCGLLGCWFAARGQCFPSIQVKA